MKIALTILGGLFLVILLIMAVAFFALRAKWRRFKSSLADLASAFGGGVPSFRVTLTPEDELAWQHGEALAAFSKAAEGAGFQSAGDFEIEEMWGVKLRGFVNAEDKLAMAYYEHGKDKIIADVVAQLRDGRWQTVSTAPEQGMERPDFAPMTRLDADLLTAGAEGLGQLLSTMASLAPVAEREPLTVEGFGQLFMDAYAREMDWRIERGGVTAEEVRAVAAAGGQERPDEEGVRQVQAAWKKAIADYFDEQFREAVLAANLFTAAEWEKRSEDLLFVYDESDAERLGEKLAWRLIEDDENDEDDEEFDAHEAKAKELAGHLRAVDGGMRAAAKSVFGSFPAARACVCKGSVTVGTRDADVWLMPPCEDHE